MQLAKLRFLPLHQAHLRGDFVVPLWSSRVIVFMLGGGGLKWAVGDCGWFEKWQQRSNAMRQYEFLCAFTSLGSCKKPCKILHWGCRKDHIGIHTNIMLCHTSLCRHPRLCTSLCNSPRIGCGLKWLYGCKTLPFGCNINTVVMVMQLKVLFICSSKRTHIRCKTPTFIIFQKWYSHDVTQFLGNSQYKPNCFFKHFSFLLVGFLDGCDAI
jgi:hypothetical protein